MLWSSQHIILAFLVSIACRLFVRSVFGICEYDQRKRVQKRGVGLLGSKGSRLLCLKASSLHFLLRPFLLFLPFYLYPILCPGYVISPPSIQSWAYRSTVRLHLIVDRTSLDRIRVCIRLRAALGATRWACRRCPTGNPFSFLELRYPMSF